MSVAENKKIVRTFVDAVFGGINRETAIDFLADDCTWWMIGDLPTSGFFEGKQTIIDKVLSADGGVIEPGSFFAELKTLIGEGDHVAVEWTGGFKTVTGADYQNHYNVMFEVGGGKIKAIREYNDTHYLMSFLTGG